MGAKQGSLFPGIISDTVVPIEQAPYRPASSGIELYRRLVAIYGTGPEGAICSQCVYFWRKKRANVYFKCRLAGNSDTPRTDWRARWPACGRFTPREARKA